MQLDALGPLRVRRQGHGTTTPTGLQALLLAMLLSAAGRPVAADRLIDALWGEDPGPQTTHRLQTHVHRLRHVLGPDAQLDAEPGGYRLRLPPGATDLDRFGELMHRAEASAADEPGRSVDLLTEALGLWRGAPFGGLEAPVLHAEAQRLQSMRLTAVERLHAAHLGAGMAEEVIRGVPPLLEDHPLRERLYELLIIAHTACGRRDEALAVHRQARTMLADRLGIDPGPGLRRLEARLLDGTGSGAGHGAETETGLPGAEAPAADHEVPPPAQLPPPPRGFQGREDLLAQLDAQLASTGSAAARSQAPVVVLTGGAGVGKSALSRHWAHRAADDFPDGCLYADLRGFGPDRPTDPFRTLAWFLIALGVDPARMPPTCAGRTALLQARLTDRRVLIVLDDAAGADQVRPFLPGPSHSAVLVTSRVDLEELVGHDGAQRVRVPLMSPEEARRLIRRTQPAEFAPELVDALAEACAHLPLALGIAAERLREQTVETAPALLEDLRDEQLRLDLLDSGDAGTSVRSVFSWSFQRLSPASARLFRLLGTAPAGRLDVDAVASLAGLGTDEAGRALEVLGAAHLVEGTDSGWIGQHGLLRDYAAELAGEVDGEEAAPAAFSRLCDHLLASTAEAVDLQAVQEESPLQGRFAGPEEARHWLLAMIDTLTLAAEQAAETGPLGFATDLAGMLRRHLDEQRQLDCADRLHRAEARAARRLGEVDAESHAELSLGAVAEQRGRLEQAEPHLRRAMSLGEEAGDIALQSTVRARLGPLLVRLRRPQEALDLLRADPECASQPADPSRPASPTGVEVMLALAGCLRDLGHLDEAETWGRRALRACSGEGSERRTAALRSLVRIVEARGDDEQCRILASEALAAGEDGAADGAADGAVLRACLGSALSRLGEQEEGQAQLRCAMELAESSQDDEAAALAHLLRGRSLVDQDPALALHHLRTAAALAEERWPLQLCCLNALTEVHRRLRDPSAAEDALAQARRLGQEAGVSG